MIRTFVCAAVLLCIAPAVRAGDDDLLTVKGQPKQQYYLIGADAAPKDKPCGLLVVMPGGDGSKQFHPFVTAIQQALPEGYLVAQLVAVQTDGPNKVVWPTEKLKDPKQNFSTQQFITNVVKEVKAKHKIDDARVFALGWSSSGSPTYASVLTPISLVTGAIVAMSVFHPQNLPSLGGAKGKRLVILHAPGDKVVPVRFAQAAEKQLKGAGAEVQYAEMAGGHGWEDDPLGRIKSGVEWLEQGAAKR